MIHWGGSAALAVGNKAHAVDVGKKAVVVKGTVYVPTARLKGQQ
jgi:hypothetical protein